MNGRTRQGRGLIFQDVFSLFPFPSFLSPTGLPCFHPLMQVFLSQQERSASFFFVVHQMRSSTPLFRCTPFCEQQGLYVFKPCSAYSLFGNLCRNLSDEFSISSMCWGFLPRPQASFCLPSPLMQTVFYTCRREALRHEGPWSCSIPGHGGNRTVVCFCLSFLKPIHPLPLSL